MVETICNIMYERIQEHKYEGKMDYPSSTNFMPTPSGKEEYNNAKKEWRISQNKAELLFWEDLRALTGDALSLAQFDALSTFAWEERHSSGLADVLYMFEDILNIITAE